MTSGQLCVKKKKSGSLIYENQSSPWPINIQGKKKKLKNEMSQGKELDRLADFEPRKMSV